MCPRGRPRGQGRLQGLHLCYLPSSLSACKMKCIMDQKWNWIADSIDCTDDNSIAEEKN